MSMYWILFIGIAIISYIVQASLQSKFKKYLKSATKLFSVLLASKRPLITELADN